MSINRLRYVITFMLIPALVMAWDPEPFRRDHEIEGRDFEYGDLQFLHEYTYRYRAEVDRAWRRKRQGFRTTVGSVSSREFYVLEEFRKRFDLSESLMLEVRHKLDEDFDGPYDRTLTGFGWKFNEGWTASLVADYVRAKENVDGHLEVDWRNANGRALRLAIVIPDATFNRKVDDDGYQKRPLTLYGEWQWVFDADIRLAGWLNINTALELNIDNGDTLFSYDEYSGGLEAVLPLGEVWQMVLEGEIEEGNRNWKSVSFPPDDRSFRRDHILADLSFERPMGDSMGLWFGARYFLLKENDDRSAGHILGGERNRDEKMLHAGVLYRLSENIIFWPGIYFNHVDNENDFPNNDALAYEKEKLFSKAAFPIEFCFKDNASVTLNPTMRLDKLRFGGMNVQVFYPF